MTSRGWKDDTPGPLIAFASPRPVGEDTRATVAELLAQLARQEPWRAKAACASADTALFFSEEPADIAHALAICARCPVAAPCRETAVERGETGVWGGVEMQPPKRTRTRKAA